MEISDDQNHKAGRKEPLDLGPGDSAEDDAEVGLTVAYFEAGDVRVRAITRIELDGRTTEDPDDCNFEVKAS